MAGGFPGNKKPLDTPLGGKLAGQLNATVEIAMVVDFECIVMATAVLQQTIICRSNFFYRIIVLKKIIGVLNPADKWLHWSRNIL